MIVDEFTYVDSMLSYSSYSYPNIAQCISRTLTFLNLGSYYFTIETTLGSVREMTNNSGSTVYQLGYDPFGQPTTIQGSQAPDFQYANYYFHSPSGFYITRSRLYSSKLGRFINRDPIEEQGGINLYNYADNRPTYLSDPSGHYIKANCSDFTILCPLPNNGQRENPITHVKAGIWPPTHCAQDCRGSAKYFLSNFQGPWRKYVFSGNIQPDGGYYDPQPIGISNVHDCGKPYDPPGDQAPLTNPHE